MYKFVVSIGLLVVGLGVALPWLVLSDIGALRISERELRRLTPVARDAIETKQRQQRWLVDHHLYGTAALVGVGAAITLYGLAGWRRRQNVLDRLENTQLDTAVVQLRQLAPEEVAERREAEVDTAFVEAPATSSSARRIELRNRIAAFEDLVMRRLQEALTESHDPPLRDVYLLQADGSTFGRRIVIDGLMRSRSANLPDLVIEVKYTSSTNDYRNRVDDAVYALTRASDAVASIGAPRTAGLAVIGVPEDLSDTPRVEQINPTRPMGRVAVLSTSLSWLEHVDRSELRRMIEVLLRDSENRGATRGGDSGG